MGGARYHQSRGGIRRALEDPVCTLSFERCSSGATDPSLFVNSVNSIHPGLIKSEMTKGADWVDSSLKTTPVGDMMLQSVPAGRFGEPAEVGHLVMTLASPEASYLNGQSFVIDGGFFQA